MAAVSPASAGTMAVADIVVGTRHRKDLGDVDGLAASIAELGLLHPIVVTPDGKLIAGERRLTACKQLGWTEVPITVVDLDDIVRGELAENAIRKDFLPSEIEAIRRAFSARVATPEGRPKTSENFASFDRGKTSDKVGAFAGVSGRTVEKIAKVVQAPSATKKEKDETQSIRRLRLIIWPATRGGMGG
jgi:ParB family chromosome partitioning protein